MKNWQYIGTILTGVAALITAGIGLYEKLHTLQTEVYKPILRQTIKRGEYGIVDDKDGWVNLREAPDASSSSLAKILNGTNLKIINKTGSWFEVTTESGRTGYIYKDRLKLVIYEETF